MNEIVKLTTVSDLMTEWPLFREGLVALNDTIGIGEKATPESFFLLLLQIVQKGPSFGIVWALKSSEGTPLGFIVVYDNTDVCFSKSAIVYAVYSNKKCGTTRAELQQASEKWARTQGFKKLHACSRRMNGSVLRLFEKKCGYRRMAMFFEKEL